MAIRKHQIKVDDTVDVVVPAGLNMTLGLKTLLQQMSFETGKSYGFIAEELIRKSLTAAQRKSLKPRPLPGRKGLAAPAGARPKKRPPGSGRPPCPRTAVERAQKKQAIAERKAEALRKKNAALKKKVPKGKPGRKPRNPSKKEQAIVSELTPLTPSVDQKS